VHDLYRLDPEVRDAVVGRFGEAVLDVNGAVDRGRVADVVFADRAQLAWLEALLHPRVQASYVRRHEELDARLFVVEVPLLYEAGSDAFFDRVIVVTAPAGLRETRLGRTLTERESRLLPEDEKVARADFVLVNDGSFEAVDAFVSDVLANLGV
jgi:dephospho-CoA kinase